MTATRDIQPFEKLEVAHVRITDMPMKAVHPSSLVKVEDILDTYSRTKICKGQVLLAGHIVSGMGRSADIPPGARLMFVPVSQNRALGGLVNEGERVDFIYALKPSTYGGGGALATTVLRDVLVVCVLKDPKGDMQGLLVQAAPDECELLAGYLESGSVYATLTPDRREMEEVETKYGW